jgi:hypothetical protein
MITRSSQLLLAVSGLVLASVTGARADTFYATSVVSRQVGSPNQSAFQDTSDALGGPTGGGLQQGGTDVLNLGVGGSLTLAFDDGVTPRGIRDQAGADFIVFENAFYAGGVTTASMAELVFVEVSSNGTDFARFPVTSLTANPVGAFGTIDPANVSDFAGVHPVLANVSTNAIDPFDPSVAGGDAFDLSALSTNPLVTSGTLDLQNVRYLRLIDVLGDGTLTDVGGRPIYDATGSGNGGADIDSVSVIHGAVLPEPGSATLFTAACGLALLRRQQRS